MDISQIQSEEDLRRYETELRSSANSELSSLSESQRWLEKRLSEIEAEMDRQEQRWQDVLAENQELHRQLEEERIRADSAEAELEQLSEIHSEIINLIRAKLPDLYEQIAERLA